MIGVIFMRKILFLIIACLAAGNISVTYILGAPTNKDDSSDWAKKEITQAIEKGLVPDELQCDYKNNITRADFCKLCVALMKAWDNNFEYKIGNLRFSDTSDEEVLICADKGIIRGVGNNKFAPDEPVKRQDAANILYNTLKAVSSDIVSNHINTDGTDKECCIFHSFDDGEDIRAWTRNAVNHMYRYGVMLGENGSHFFNPNGQYTREQAICTFLRLYNCKDNISLNPIPESDYYPYGDSTMESYYGNGHWITIGFNKNVVYEYIDSKGKKYTSAEKGFVYPFDYPCMSAVINVGPGVTEERVYDKNGDECFPELAKRGDYLSAVKITPDSVFGYKRDSSGCILYRMPDKKEIFSGGDYWSIGENLYALHYNEFIINIINLDGTINIDCFKGYTKIGDCVNGVFIIGNENGEYSVVNTKGEILKNLKVDSSWDFQQAFGYTMEFKNNKNNIIFDAYDEKVVDCIDNSKGTLIDFYDNGDIVITGDILTFDESYFRILNPDKSVKFDGKKLGYTGVNPIKYGLYLVYKDGKGVAVIGKNGNLIINYPKNTFDIDKGGILAYNTDDGKICFIDFYGDKIGEFDYKSCVSNTPSIKEFYFINGLLYVNIGYTVGETEIFKKFYVSPNGKAIEWR